MRVSYCLRAGSKIVMAGVLATGCGWDAHGGAAPRDAVGQRAVPAQPATLPHPLSPPPSDADAPVPEVPAAAPPGRPATSPGALTPDRTRQGERRGSPAPLVGALPPPVPGRPNGGGDHHPIVGAESVGTIEIPRIGLIHPIFEGTDLPHLHWGPGHWPGTALPGQVGNVVLAGHRVTHTRPFLDIDRLVPGDLIIFHLGGTTSTYRVTGHQIVGPDEVSIADPDFPHSTVTLLACHPKGSAARRYVVRGELIPVA